MKTSYTAYPSYSANVFPLYILWVPKFMYKYDSDFVLLIQFTNLINVFHY